MPVQEMTDHVRQTNRERLKEITDSIEKGIKQLFESDRYRKYLTTMSRFPKYSVNNQMLIYMQNPDATRVAGYSVWHDRFGRNVLEGQHGIKIIAPVPYRKKVETEKKDPETSLPLMDADGNILKEQKEISVPMFRPVTVFDVSQTEGRPLPRLAEELRGGVEDFDAFMEALKRTSPVPVNIEPMPDKADGYYDRDSRTIHIREGMSETGTVSATLHEIAHSMLHNYAGNEYLDSDDRFDKADICGRTGLFIKGKIDREKLPDGLYCYDIRGTDRDPGSLRYLENSAAINRSGSVITAVPVDLPDNGRLDIRNRIAFTGEQSTVRQLYEEAYPERAVKARSTREVEAESVSFAVCAYYGIATGENSFGYIAGWSRDRDLGELKSSLETINKTSCELISEINRNYAEILKERSMGKSFDGMSAERNTEKQEADARDAAPDTVLPDPKIGEKDMNIFGYTDPGMLPLTKDRAAELSELDVPVYLLYPDNTESMAGSISEISGHDGLFGITREDWAAVGKTVPARDIEKRFDGKREDSLLIYQLKETAPENLRFISYGLLNDPPSRDNYEAVYTQPYSENGPTGDVLEQIFDRFNIGRPADFCSHSLSVSDIVALRRGDETTYHYCDSIGFRQLENFRHEAVLENVEKTSEKDPVLSAEEGKNDVKEKTSGKGQSIKSPAKQDMRQPAAKIKRKPLPEKKHVKPAKKKNNEMEI